jgi:hypothetical protein
MMDKVSRDATNCLGKCKAILSHMCFDLQAVLSAAWWRCKLCSVQHGGGEDLLENHGKILGVQAHVGMPHGKLLAQSAK